MLERPKSAIGVGWVEGAVWVAARGGGGAARLDHVGEAEVGDLDVEGLVQQQVLRLPANIYVYIYICIYIYIYICIYMYIYMYIYIR